MFGRKKKTIEDTYKAFWEKRLSVLREEFGALSDKVMRLEAENAALRGRVGELENRIVSLEKSYGPLFDYFLREKEPMNPNRPEFFQPQHVIHPDGDYEEKRQ